MLEIVNHSQELYVEPRRYKRLQAPSQHSFGELVASGLNFTEKSQATTSRKTWDSSEGSERAVALRRANDFAKSSGRTWNVAVRQQSQLHTPQECRQDRPSERLRGDSPDKDNRDNPNTEKIWR